MKIKPVVKLIIKYFYPPLRRLLFFFRTSNNSVKVVIFFKNKILLIKNTYRKGWTFPGGGVKTNESCEEAAIREVSEEVAIHINKMKNHGFFNSGTHKNNKTTVFSCKVKTANIKIDDLEVEKAIWVDIDKASRLQLLPVATQCVRLLNLFG